MSSAERNSASVAAAPRSNTVLQPRCRRTSVHCCWPAIGPHRLECEDVNANQVEGRATCTGELQWQNEQSCRCEVSLAAKVVQQLEALAGSSCDAIHGVVPLPPAHARASRQCGCHATARGMPRGITARVHELELVKSVRVAVARVNLVEYGVQRGRVIVCILAPLASAEEAAFMVTATRRGQRLSKDQFPL